MALSGPSFGSSQPSAAAPAWLAKQQYASLVLQALNAAINAQDARTRCALLVFEAMQEAKTAGREPDNDAVSDEQTREAFSASRSEIEEILRLHTAVAATPPPVPLAHPTHAALGTLLTARAENLDAINIEFAARPKLAPVVRYAPVHTQRLPNEESWNAARDTFRQALIDLGAQDEETLYELGLTPRHFEFFDLPDHARALNRRINEDRLPLFLAGVWFQHDVPLNVQGKHSEPFAHDLKGAPYTREGYPQAINQIVRLFDEPQQHAINALLAESDPASGSGEPAELFEEAHDVLSRIRDLAFEFSNRQPPHTAYNWFHRALSHFVVVWTKGIDYRLFALASEHFPYPELVYQRVFPHENDLPTLKFALNMHGEGVRMALLRIASEDVDLLIETGVPPPMYMYFGMTDVARSIYQMSQRGQLPAFVTRHWP